MLEVDFGSKRSIVFYDLCHNNYRLQSGYFKGNSCHEIKQKLAQTRDEWKETIFRLRLQLIT